MKRMPMGVVATVSSLLVLGLPLVSSAYDYTIQGKIRTSSGGAPGCDRVVKLARVAVLDQTTGFQVGDYGLTDPSTGAFTISFADDSPSMLISVVVVHLFRVTPNRYVEVWQSEYSTTPMMEICQGSIIVYPGITDLGTKRISNKANIGTEIGDCLRWVVAHSSWSMPHNAFAYPIAGNKSECPGITIRIAEGDYNGTHAMSDIHHETGHFIQYTAYGGSWPGQSFFPPPSHDFDTESDEGFAIMEGFAEFVAYCTYIEASDPPPKKYLPYQPGAAVWWRGKDGTGTDNAGDIVEGALFRIWADVDDFAGILKTLEDDDPDHLKQWVDGYLADGGSAYNTFAACQKNGVVYTRGKMLGFLAPPPGHDAPGDEGNSKPINGIMFLRGEVGVDYHYCSKGELNLGENASLISRDKLAVYYKQANPGLAEATHITDWWANSFGDADWGTTYEMDTAPSAGVMNGDYDLIICLRNIHQWWDNFDPDFLGDAVTNRNSDEKWLKYLRTWYRQGDSSDPPQDHESKVIIDNDPPTISNVKPAQNVD